MQPMPISAPIELLPFIWKALNGGIPAFCLLFRHFMKQLLTSLFSLMVSSQLLAGELITLTPEQLLEMQHSQKALVVDIRTPQEWQSSGVIANSHKLQSFDADGKFDQQKWLADLEKLKTSPDQPVILVCRSGNRSSKVGNILSQQLGIDNVYHLSNGLQGWIKTGHPVKADCPADHC